MHNFVCQNVPIFSFYIFVTRQIETLWCKVIDTFWSGGKGTVWHKKLQMINRQYSRRFSELYQHFRHIFLCETLL